MASIDFRGFIAPASLKSGLVSPLAYSAADFRGFIAPASLKYSIDIKFLRLSQRFPGLHRPGLIEVATLLPACGMTPHDFRGFIAPASLKFETIVTAAEAEAGFPGLHRPGLIEVVRERGSDCPPLRFPGLHRPGLIEAYSGARRPWSATPISGASSPRPH